MKRLTAKELKILREINHQTSETGDPVAYIKNTPANVGVLSDLEEKRILNIYECFDDAFRIVLTMQYLKGELLDVTYKGISAKAFNKKYCR